METTPLILRVGMRGPTRSGLVDSDETLTERLPYVVEVHAGTVLQVATKVTEVRRETTDDK